MYIYKYVHDHTHTDMHTCTHVFIIPESTRMCLVCILSSATSTSGLIVPAPPRPTHTHTYAQMADMHAQYELIHANTSYASSATPRLRQGCRTLVALAPPMTSSQGAALGLDCIAPP